MEYYSATRKDERLPFVKTWVDLENIMLSKISQTESVKNNIISHMWDINPKLIVTDDSVVVTTGKGVGGIKG